MAVIQKSTLRPVPPFDFDLSAEIFSDGNTQIRKYEKGKFSQVLRIENRLVLLILRASGTVDKPRLIIELRARERIPPNCRKKAEQIVQALFNLKFDLKRFYEEVKNDRILSGLTQKMRGLKSPTTPTIFEALIDSIVEQQISLNVANAIETKLFKTFGDTLTLDGETYYTFPTPQKMASVSVQQLRNCGLSSRKAEYVREVSKLIADGKLDLEKLKSFKNPKRIVSELDKIRGIGVWTAELTMVRGMQRLEAIPADDLGLRRAISHFYCEDRKILSEEARKISEKWGKWKGLASFYLIMAEILESRPNNGTS